MRQLAHRAPLLAPVGATLGIFWGVADISQTLIGYDATIASSVMDPNTIDVVTTGMQDAAHFRGGPWTLSLAVADAPLFAGSIARLP